MWLKCDFHIHSSEDPIDMLDYTAKEVIDRYSEQGFDAIAIALHEGIGWTKQLDAYSKKRGVLLIPATERIISGKHILILSDKVEKIRKIMKINKLKQLKSRNDLMIVAPHPFFPFDAALQEDFFDYHKYFDAVELTAIFSRLTDFNKMAYKIAKAFNKPLLANTDLHTIEYAGQCYNLLPCRNNALEIFKAIRKNKSIPIMSQPLSERQIFYKVTI